MPGRVEGKVAFITGAARGQGRSHAVRLAQEGADIIAVDICAPVATASYAMSTPEDLAETVRLVENEDRRIIAAQADTRDRATLKRILDDAVAELGHLDTVVPSAGIVSYGAIDEITEDTWREMLEINLTGVWNTCVVAKPHLLANKGGSYVLTSSGAAVRPPANLAHYSAAKAGVVALMKTLAKELAPHMIRANAIHPTTVDTDMVMNDETFKLYRPDLANPGREDIVDPATAINLLPTPWVQPIDISNGVLYLASDEARYVTGVHLGIDAGFGAV